MRWIKISSVTAVILVFFLCGQAAGHRVNVFAWAEGGTVHVTGKLADGGTISEGSVKVYNEKDNLLIEGKTDDQGEFSFPIPEISDLKIQISAGPGHKGEWMLSKDELSDAAVRDKKAEGSSDSGGQKDEKPSGSSDSRQNNNGEETYSSRQIRQAVDEAVEKALDEALEERLDRMLEKRLAPVMRTLSEIKNPGPTASDIFGGLGYIIGLFGIAAYMYSRRS
ncbi:MAG: hypothetical protein ACQETG_00560 [Thermodesulfobacteriota bacterium]